MNIERIHHIAIIVSDIEKSVDFYCNLLNGKVIERTFRRERDSWKVDIAIADGAQLELFTFPGAPERASYPERLGLRHIAFAVQDIDAAFTEIQTAGIASEDAVRLDEVTKKKFFFCFDPDNLPIEFYEASV